MSVDIHPTAIVESGALLDDGVSVGPFCLVSGQARIGRGTRLRSHVVIEGRTTIGQDCDIYPFAVIGGAPQDLKYKGEDTELVIGNGNVMRESVTIHRASVGGDMKTVVGDNNFLMGYVHIAHDCKVGSHVIMANYSGLSGHVTVGDRVVMGGLSGIQQHARIGSYAMIGGMSRLANDVPPYVICSGSEKPKLFGLNLVGLRRNGFAEGTIAELKQAFNILFTGKHTRAEALRVIQEELPYTEEIKYLVEFVSSSKAMYSRM